MDGRKIAIIGGGNMGVALAKGIIQTKWAKPANLIVSEPLKDKHAQLKEIAKGVKVTVSNKEAAKFADVIILSVKPQIMLRIISEIKPTMNTNKLLISVAAASRRRRWRRRSEAGYPS